MIPVFGVDIADEVDSVRFDNSRFSPSKRCVDFVQATAHPIFFRVSRGFKSAVAHQVGLPQIIFLTCLVTNHIVPTFINFR